MVITYPQLTVVDDSGAIVSGATVTITSVKDKAGADIASPGATVNQSGANVSVDYDAETKGEAWVVLAISKGGSTFTGLNAAPAFYLARDSSRLLNGVPILNAEALTGTVVSATAISVTINVPGGVPAWGQTTNAYLSNPPYVLKFTSLPGRTLGVAITGSSYSAPNLTLNFAATTGVGTAPVDSTVQVD